MSALLVSATFLTILVPVASAGPDCVMVYPWSELCQGDVEGFVDAVSPCDLDLDCVSTTEGFPGGYEPNCLQVYPWSELCQGDVPGFIDALNVPCENGECVSVDKPSLPWPPVTVDCIQALPWSHLCNGNVVAFVEYYTGPLGDILA
jgi:hypothetical protein